MDPAGRRVDVGFGWQRVVDVVENVAEADLTDEPEPALYVFSDQVPCSPEL